MKDASSRFVFGIVALGAIVFAVVFAWRGETPGPRGTGEAGTGMASKRLDVTARARAVADAQPERVLDAGSSVGNCVIAVVVDESGRPVSGADVYVADEFASRISVRSKCGLTGDSGLCEVAAAKIREGGGAVVASKTGYRNASAKVADGDGGEVHIVLKQGFGQEFVFVDADSKPCAGVRVYMSMVTMDEEGQLSMLDDQVPGSSRFAGYCAESGKEGAAIVEGLDIGEWYVCFDAGLGRGLALPSPLRSLRVPGPPVRIQIGRLLAAAVVVVGDEVLEATGTCVGVDMNGVSAAAFRRERKRVQELYGADAATVALPSVRGTNREMQWWLLLKRTGWRYQTTPFMELTESFRPTTVSIGADVPDVGMATLSLIANGKGIPADWKVFAIREVLARDSSLGAPVRMSGRFDLTIGESLRMPAGSYQITCNDQLFAKSLTSRDLELKTGDVKEIGVGLPDGCDLWRIEVVWPGGQHVPRCGVDVIEDATGATIAQVFKQPGDPCYMLVPSDRACTFKVSCSGFQDVVAQIIRDPLVATQVARIVVR